MKHWASAVGAAFLGAVGITSAGTIVAMTTLEHAGFPGWAYIIVVLCFLPGKFAHWITHADEINLTLGLVCNLIGWTLVFSLLIYFVRVGQHKPRP